MTLEQERERYEQALEEKQRKRTLEEQDKVKELLETLDGYIEDIECTERSMDDSEMTDYLKEKYHDFEKKLETIILHDPDDIAEEDYILLQNRIIEVVEECEYDEKQTFEANHAKNILWRLNELKTDEPDIAKILDNAIKKVVEKRDMEIIYLYKKRIGSDD